MRHSPSSFNAQSLWSHRRLMRAIAFDLVRDEHEAEDVVQQAWMKALQQPPGSIAKPAAWLSAVVRNLARSAVGRQARRRDVELTGGVREPESISAKRDFELQHELSAALRALPERYREVLHQRYFRDATPTEIAQRLGLSVDTVKTRLRRGLELLRSDLDARHGGRRESWCVPFVALLRESPGAVSPTLATSSGSAILSGVLAMKSLAVAAVSATLVAAIAIAILLTREDVRPLDGNVAAPKAYAGAGLVDVAATPTVPGARLGDTARDSVETRPGDAAGENGRAVASLEVVDSGGRSLAGVRVFFSTRRDEAAVTDDDGRATLRAPPDDRRTGAGEYTLHFEAPEYLPLRQLVRVPPGEPVDLGRFVLVPGGSVAGIVLDRSGAPLPAARVLVTDPNESIWQSVIEVAEQFAPERVAWTDAYGRFRVRGLPSGSLRVWAGAPGFQDGSSAVVAVVAGRVSERVEVVLDQTAAASEIAGRVLMPAGLRPDRLNVWYRYEADEGVRTHRAPLMSDGSFRCRLEQDVPHDLWVAQSPGGSGAAAPGLRGIRAQSVAPGTMDLVLALERAPTIEVSASDRSGVPIESGEVELVEFSGNDLRQQLAWTRGVTLPFEIDAPAARFFVTVAAPGYARASKGPFEPGSPPHALHFELQRGQSAIGTVTADGEPVAGARVELLRAGSGRHRITRRGFLLRMRATVSSSAVTSSDGAFALSVPAEGDYFVLATAPGRAAAEVGPLSLDPASEPAPLELAMTRGGSIEGQLLLPSGEDPTGWLVGASRGDPYERTAAVAADGRYRFERLTPGEWSVQRALAGSRVANRRSSPTSVVWSGNCVVREGETTRFDLDLRGGTTCVLRGRLALPGPHSQASRIELRRDEGRPGEGTRVDDQPLAENGSFELVAPNPGAYHLMVRSDELLLLRAFELTGGMTEWSESVEIGVLSGRVDLARFEEEPWLVWIAKQGANMSAARLPLDADGSFSCAVPTGPGAIHYATPRVRAESQPQDWPVLGEAHVAAGVRTSFDG